MFCLRMSCPSAHFCICMSPAFSPSGCFVPPDILSSQTFCFSDVLSSGRLVLRMLCLWLLYHQTFCLRMFCPARRYVSGRFVWTPCSVLCNIYVILTTLRNLASIIEINLRIFVVVAHIKRRHSLPKIRGITVC
jgi:hypothetical protein